MGTMTRARGRHEGAGEQLRLVRPTYLTVGQVADLLGVAPSFVYRRTSKGHPDPIPCYRFGSHLRFLEAEVNGWAVRHRKEADPTPGIFHVVGAASLEGHKRVRLRVRQARS
jgi:excisionase family DNA binding protein